MRRDVVVVLWLLPNERFAIYLRMLHKLRFGRKRLIGDQLTHESAFYQWTAEMCIKQIHQTFNIFYLLLHSSTCSRDTRMARRTSSSSLSLLKWKKKVKYICYFCSQRPELLEFFSGNDKNSVWWRHRLGYFVTHSVSNAKVWRSFLKSRSYISSHNRLLAISNKANLLKFNM